MLVTEFMLFVLNVLSDGGPTWPTRELGILPFSFISRLCTFFGLYYRTVY
jgi:hypothetical protein